MIASPGPDTGTTAMREGFSFDVVALEAWMRAHIANYLGPLAVQQFSGGQSNPTYKLITPKQTYVLRRKPPGQLVKGAHAVEREARVLKALGAAGFSVPHVRGLCTDDTVIGTWFYVMDMVEGRIFWDATFPDVSSADRHCYFDAMNATLARLHDIDYRAIGLEDYGRPGNYFARQIMRWSKQYMEDTEAGRDPYMDQLVAWLPANVPAGDETSLVHGDYRCDNIIFHPSEPKVLAVLDWELSTLGHPGADFANHAMMYRMPPHIVAGLACADLAELGIPTEQDYLAAYCKRRGLGAMPGYEFYIAFNFFRLAAIFHGIRGRVIRGTAASAHAKERAANFPALAKLAYLSAESCR